MCFTVGRIFRAIHPSRQPTNQQEFHFLSCPQGLRARPSWASPWSQPHPSALLTFLGKTIPGLSLVSPIKQRGSEAERPSASSAGTALFGGQDCHSCLLLPRVYELPRVPQRLRCNHGWALAWLRAGACSMLATALPGRTLLPVSSSSAECRGLHGEDWEGPGDAPGRWRKGRTGEESRGREPGQNKERRPKMSKQADHKTGQETLVLN